MQFISLLGIGFLLGLKHALDADHIAAVSTMISQTKDLKKSFSLGALWGLGHTATLFLVGTVILGWKLVIPEKLVWSFEILVGIVLIALGLDVLYQIRKRKLHIHEHSHGDKQTHVHLHSHEFSESHHHAHRSFGLGLLHGLAGSGALTLLVLATAPGLWQGLLFIGVFGAGSILGMLLASTIISLPFLVTANFAKLNYVVQTTAGIASIAVGTGMVYEIAQKLA